MEQIDGVLGLAANHVYNMDCLKGLKLLSDACIDLTVTSPPYDDLRTYNGYSVDIAAIAVQLYRVTKQGGVVVWVVGDMTRHGTETCTAFKQALFFKDVVGFNLWDTMIFQKIGGLRPNPGIKRYAPEFDFMFVFTKGTPKTFHGQMVPCSCAGQKINATKTQRQRDGRVRKITGTHASVQKTKRKGNIWSYGVGYMHTTRDKIAYKHPAMFPEKLVEDHICSWSNEGDIILDPFVGSGTTPKMALLNHRKYIGFEIDKVYCEIAQERIAQAQALA